MENKELQFLWDLICFCWLQKKPEKAQELASNIYSLSINLPADLEEQVVKFWSSRDESAIEYIALVSARKYCFDGERHIVLVSLLVEKNLLHINEAAPLLIKINATRSQLGIDRQLRKVIDVAWLVNEDFRDGVMEAQDDSLLQEVLKEVVAAAREQN